ncbi:MAG: DUF2240 family protein [Candidatus Thermoplasmatota archaeon]|nr:DUF2240 family protein [Candidatus Thermoplasmatota archaeon]
MGDFVKELAFKRKLLPAEEIEKFVNKSVENKLLIQEGDKYKSNFVVTEYTIPLDFTVDLQDLYSDRERDFLDRVLETITSKGKIKAEDALKRAKDLTSYLRYIDFNIAILAVATEEGINVKEYLDEV